MARGRGAGITGFFDLKLTGSQPAVKFFAKLYGYTALFRAAVKPRIGRGSGGGAKVRLGNLQGAQGSARGKMQPSAFPAPAMIQQAAGSVTIKVYDNCSFTVPVRCSGISITEAEETTDLPDITFEWQVDGYPTWSWNGTQQTTTAPTANAIELYEGLLKQLDPNGLQDGGKQTLDLEGVDDSDAAEIAAIAGYIGAATTPITGLKLRSYAFTRDSFNGGTLSLEWARRDTKDDQELPHRVTTTDPEGLQSEASDASLDGTPATPSGFVVRSSSTLKPTDSRTVTVKKLGLRTTKQDVEFEQSKVKVDPTGIDTAGQQVEVFTTGSPPADPTPPANTKIVGSFTQQLTDAGTTNKSVKGWEFGPRTRQDSIEFDGTWKLTDPSGLESRALATKVGSAPTLPSGFVSRGNRIQTYSDFATIYVAEGGIQTTAQEIENRGSSAVRSAIEPHTQTDVTVVDSTDAAGTIADTVFATFKDVAYAFKVVVTKPNPAKAVITKHYLNPGCRLVGRTWGNTRPVLAQRSGNQVQVYVARVRGRGGSYWVNLTPSILSAYLRRFTMFVTTVGTQVPEYLSLLNHANNAIFLGMPVNTCVYKGPEYASRVDLAGNIVFQMGYEFFFDSVGIFNLYGFDKSFIWPSNPGTGWVEASTVGLNYSLPPAGDFSLFQAFVSSDKW